MNETSLPQGAVNPVFDDPRFRMTVVGRIAVRVAAYLVYLLLGALTVTFLISDVEWFFWVGMFLVLVLGDRLVHLREADEPLSEAPRQGTVNVARYTVPAASSLLERGYDRSVLSGRPFRLELLRVVLRTREMREAFARLDVSLDEVRQKTDEYLAQPGEVSRLDRAALLAQGEELMRGAFRIAQGNNPRFVDVGDLAAALFFSDDLSIRKLLVAFGFEAQDIAEALQFAYVKQEFRRRSRIPETLSAFIMGGQRGMRHRVMNRAWTARPTPALDRASTDLTDLARRGAVGFLVGHDEEYGRLLDALSRPASPNALLVGEAGVGKETIIQHFAYELTKDRVPPPLFDRRLIALDLPALVAGAAPEELQKRLQQIMEEIQMAGNVILYIPDIHNLMKTSGTAYLSAADALLPLITNDAFPVVGATYPREFKEFIEPRSDFTGAFEVIRVNEISEAEARKVLISESLLFEAENKVTISFGAVKTAVRLAKKYFRENFLPSSAESLLKDAIALTLRNGTQAVGPAEIVRVAEAKTKIPLHETTGDEAQALLHLEEKIHERLVDQEEAVKAICDALREFRSGLARPGGPIANFLFVGPTGVGKTELSKILAEVQFGSEKAMVRFDMTEYQDKQSFYRFIGSPDGTVRGALTDAVQEAPYSLVLLDEFEKAYPDILNLFLQVMDDGRLTDNFGRTVDFTNTIIIATSNAHSDLVHEALLKGQTMADIADYLKKKLTDVFRPELLNRFSKIIVFRDLAPEHIKKIALLNLQALAASVAAQGITLTWDEAAQNEVVRLGYDPAFGARPLRRVIEEHIKAPLAEKLLSKEVGRGGALRLTFAHNAFVLSSS